MLIQNWQIGCVIFLRSATVCGITHPSRGERCNARPALAPHFRKQQRRATTIMTQKKNNKPLSPPSPPSLPSASPSLSISAKARKREARVVIYYSDYPIIKGLYLRWKCYQLMHWLLMFSSEGSLFAYHPIIKSEIFRSANKSRTLYLCWYFEGNDNWHWEP